MSVATLPPAQDQSEDPFPPETWPSWLVPPVSGFTADDLDRLPGLPPHTELLNGSLVFVSPQAKWHSRVIFNLRVVLGRVLPADWRVDSEMTIRLGDRNRPEPDVLVVTTEAYAREAPATWYELEDVLLVVEVVSPESAERDREAKPAKYAKAGIEHFWRIENEDGKAVVHAYRLDHETSAYVLAGVHRGRLLLSEPFDLDIDLAEIPLRS